MSGKVGFIGGGQMAKALAAGAVAAGVLQSSELIFAQPPGPKQASLRELFSDCKVVDDATSVLADCDRIVLAVKPHILRKISSILASRVKPGHLLVSIAAGISLAELQRMLNTPRVIRVMPNTPVQVRAGASAISADTSVDKDDLAWVTKLMESVGVVDQVPDEQIHAVTGVAGSSPAYIYMVIEALSDGAVAQGLPRATATKLAAHAVLGAAKMVLDTGLHPGQLKDQVTSPGGTTIAAIRELEVAGVRSAFMEAVARSAERSQEMAEGE